MHWEERFPIFFSGYIQKQPDMEGRFPGRGEGGEREGVQKIFIINIYNGGAGGQGPKP